MVELRNKPAEGSVPDVEWSAFVPSAISTSFGGAVIGGTFANVPGALIGGAAGVVVALIAELSPRWSILK